MNKQSFKNDAYPILFLTVVVCISVVGLTLTNSVTEEKIEDARIEALNRVLSQQFPEMDHFEYHDDIDVYTIFGSEQEMIGYAFNVKAQGYGGDIELLVALENTDLSEGDIIIKGISVLSHGETPGLGAKIEEGSFLQQFEKTEVENVRLAANGGEIDAISGATVSSGAVVDAVHDLALEKAESIREKEDMGVSA